MSNKVQTVKNGFYKKWDSNSDFEKDDCPFCKIEMDKIADWYDSPSEYPKGNFVASRMDGMPHIDICEEWSQRKESMEARFSQCPKCKKIFVYWESGDYDDFHLQEVLLQNFTVKQTPKPSLNPSSRRIGTKALRELIPSWITDSKVERLRKEFDPIMPFQDLKNLMINPSNWKRICKFQHGNEIERIFDCRPLDDQLRLYVYTDLAEQKVLRFKFQTE